MCENLGTSEERISESRLGDLPGRQFGALNVLLLIHDRGWKPKPAIPTRPDAAYAHMKGMITKADTRLMGIGRLELCETDVIWDIGAGSGAVSIEMAEIAWRGQVYAVEKDARNQECLRTNLDRYGVLNVEIVKGVAPEALVDLPAPDAVFIGGNGGRLEGILTEVEKSALPGCRVVAHFTLLENLVQASRWMNAHGWQPALTEVQFSHGKQIANGTHLEPENPVFILRGTVGKGIEA